MGTCNSCGNEYDRTFELKTPDGVTMTFDTLECAIHAVAPVCKHCGIRVVGHGVEKVGHIYCCASCARSEGHEGLSDRA